MEKKERKYVLTISLLPGVALLTSSGRGTGSGSSVAKRAPPSEEHFLTKLDDLRSQLMEANQEIARLNTEVADLTQYLGDKETELRRLAGDDQPGILPFRFR